MKSYIIFMDCPGDSDHEAHKDPVMILSVADCESELPGMAAMGLSILMNSPEGTGKSISLDPDRAKEARDKILDILGEIYPKDEEDENPFDSVEIVDYKM